MTVQNGNGVNQLPGLTPELVADLEAGRVKVAELNEVQLRQLVEDEDEPGTPPAPAPAPQAPVATAAGAPGVAAPSAPAPVKEPEKPALDAVDGEEYRRKADALNNARQELDKRDRQLAEARRLADENTTRAAALAESSKNRKSVDDDGFVEDLDARMRRLEDENKSLRESNAAALKTTVETADEERRKIAVEREFLEIETFQLTSPRLGADLRTSKSIRDIDRDVGRLEGVLGKDAVAKMQTDKAYRDQMAAQGHILPPEWEKWRTVMQLHHYKKGQNALKAVFPTYNSAFVEFAQESGYLKRAVSEASLEASRETAEKLVQSSTETSLLPAESGAGGGSHLVSDQKWTREKAAEWMKTHRNPKNEEERRTQYEILAWLETQPDID